MPGCSGTASQRPCEQETRAINTMYPSCKWDRGW